LDITRSMLLPSVF